MKKLILSLAAAVMMLPLAAQTTEKEFQDRYNLLTSKLGAAGVGVGTLLDKWEEAFPDNLDMLSAKFLYHYSKGQNTEAVAKDQARYLGQKPLFELKDSLGNPVNYFQETFFDDEQFGLAMKDIDRAIELYPDRLDLRFSKITALINYEKESPDMATSELEKLMDYNFKSHPAWNYSGEAADAEMFDASMQEYLYSFFRIASPRSYEAFLSLSEKMLEYEPKNVLFMDNVGSYYLVAKKDNKTAKKYYTKVLKIKPDDITAIQNMVIMARADKDVKLEKKYLPLLAKYATDEITRKSALIRLDALGKKKK